MDDCIKIDRMCSVQHADKKQIYCVMILVSLLSDYNTCYFLLYHDHAELYCCIKEYVERYVIYFMIRVDAEKKNQETEIERENSTLIYCYNHGRYSFFVIISALSISNLMICMLEWNFFTIVS
jgi:hypothetical protein